MEASMKSTRNFEDIQKAHSVFLANVMSQTFLLSSGVEKKNPVSSKSKSFMKFKIIDTICPIQRAIYIEENLVRDLLKNR